MNKELAIECIKTQSQFVDDMTKDAFEMAIKALDGNCSEFPNNWIPCTPETMPEDGIRRLISIDNGLVVTAWFDTDTGFWRCVPHDYEFSQKETLAYMPLPAPYQPKEDES